MLVKWYQINAHTDRQIPLLLSVSGFNAPWSCFPRCEGPALLPTCTGSRKTAMQDLMIFWQHSHSASGS